MQRIALEVRNATIAESKASSELLLLEAALSGSAEAWDRLHRDFSAVISRAVLAVMWRHGVRPSNADVEDVIAETWFVLVANDCRKLRQFDQRRNLGLAGWIAMIAAQTAIAWLRARPTRRDLMALEHGLAALRSNDASAIDVRLSTRELARRMRQTMLRLSKEDRRFLRHYLHHRGAASDVARALGISVNAVYTRKHRITDRLTRAALEARTTAV